MKIRVYAMLLAASASGIYPNSAVTGNLTQPKAIGGEFAANRTTTIKRVAPLNLPGIKEVRTVWITAYSSTPEETDDTPFITASGTNVRDGVVATNLLPFKTRVKIPELFGEKVFIVEDRMHERKANNLDVWMPSKKQALIFGITRAEVVVLQ